MKKIFSFLTIAFLAIVTLVSCNKPTNTKISIKNIEVEGNLIQSQSAFKMVKLSAFAEPYLNDGEIGTEDTSDEEVTEEPKEEPTEEVQEEQAEEVIKNTVNAVLNNTSEFDVHFTVDNPKSETIDQIQFVVSEGDLEIKEVDETFKPFANYKDGIVTVISQNPSKFDITFKTEGDTKIEIKALRIKGSDWVDADQYSNLSIYKVDDLIEFIDNTTKFGYTFRTKAFEGVTVTAVSEGAVVRNLNSNKVYSMKENGTITINYDLTIENNIVLHCSQSKKIEVVDVGINIVNDEEWSDDSTIHLLINIKINNVGTGNESKKFTFTLTDSNNFSLELKRNAKGNVDLMLDSNINIETLNVRVDIE